MFFSKTLPPMPAACAECVQTAIGPLGGAIPPSTQMNQFRAANGQMRIDMGEISLITNPATGERMILNHMLLEARMLLPSAPSLPGLPGAQAPSMNMAISAAMPHLPSGVSPIQLGKSFIEGHEVEGMRYVFPAIPGAPPPSVSMWEIWNSVKLRMPVMTKTTGTFGTNTTMCRVTGVAPPPSTFQIPPGYTVIPAPVPGVPSIPSMPGAPQIPNVAMPSVPSTMPNAPSMPGIPSIPSRPSVPSTPSIPSRPSIPSVATPGMPQVPSLPNTPSIPSAPLPSVAAPNLPSVPGAPSISTAPSIPSAPAPPQLPKFKLP